MPLFSDRFGLGKTQFELDFVNVSVDADISLFIDPFAISQRPDDWSIRCHSAIQSFFERIVTSIREGNPEVARQLLSHLREPNETRFGFSASRPRGAGIGPGQSGQLFDALQASSAVITGFLNSLEDCELLVEGIGRDKISDLTTNVIRFNLAQYTKEQCALWGIPTRNVPLAPYYSLDTQDWISDYFELPITDGRPVLLVPKVIAESTRHMIIKSTIKTLCCRT